MALTINLTGVEPAFAKNTAFNKNFGTSSGDILLLGSTSVASKVLVTDSNNKVKTSSTTETQLSYLDATSSIQTQLGTKEATANKDATGGYVGLTLFKINFKNVLNTFTSFFTNSNTDARTYTFPDKNGTVAMTSDITGTNSGTNTGDQDLSTLAPKASPTFTGTVVLPTATSIGNVSSTEIGYVDGVTSAIQTQIDLKSEKSILLFSSALNLADSSDYYFSIGYVIATTSPNQKRFKFDNGSTTAIKLALQISNTNSASSELVTLNLRNQTTSTDNLIGTFDMSLVVANTNGLFEFAFSHTINTTDQWAIKMTTPAFVTNPTSSIMQFKLYYK